MNILALVFVAVPSVDALLFPRPGFAADLTASSMKQAIETRQYAVLYMGVGTHNARVSLLSTRFEGRGESVSHANLSNEEIGRAVELNDAGFDEVASRQSTEAMHSFVLRLVDHEGLQVTNEGFLQNILPYYTGECANQSLGVLRGEIQRGQHDQPCHQSWVAKKGINVLSQERRDRLPAVAEDFTKAKRKFVKAALADHGIQVVDGPEWTAFAQRVVDGNLTLTQLLMESQGQPWTAHASTDLKPTFAAEGGITDWLFDIGKTAPLNQFGYQAVLFFRDEAQMSYFIRRTAEAVGLKIADEGGLAGMTPYYSGKCAGQSYAALVKELHSIEGSKFNAEVVIELDGANASTLADLKALVAERSGVTVDHVTVEDVDVAAYADEFSQTQEVFSQINETLPAEPVADTPQAASVAYGELHVTVPARRAVRITVALDSAHAAHALADKLRSEDVVPGMSGKTLPRAKKVSQSKPAQCGGAMVTLA